MNFRNILWTYAPKQDGTCDVKVYVYTARQKKYYSTGLCVHPDQFNKKTGYVKPSHPLHKIYNSKIRELRNAVEEHFLTGGSFEDFGSRDSSGSLIEFGNQFLEECEKGLQPIKSSTAKNYKVLMNRLNQYINHEGIKDISFDKVDMDFYGSFCAFLESEANCKLAGIGKHIKNLKKLMGMAMERGLHTNSVFKESGFKAYKTTSSNKIFLTEQEIESMENLDLSFQHALEKERDRFLLSYFFLLRYSDVTSIKRENIFTSSNKKFLRMRHVKTNTGVRVPAKQKAIELLEKYDYDFTFTSNQQANRDLKSIAAIAGINQVVSEGHKQAPKCQFVCTHTARRSAATNLRLRNFSLKTIADLGGWKDLQSLVLYLRASGLDSARLASEDDFFK